MSLLGIVQQHPLTVLGTAVVLILAYGWRLRYRKDLKDVPGPFWASVTDAYRLLDALSWKSHEHQQMLHKKYGKFVRYGPNCVSVGDPAAIPQIYGINAKFPKSSFYTVQATVSNGKRVIGMFHALDDHVHAKFRKPVAHTYAMSTLLDYEPLVDRTTEYFLGRLDELYALPGKVCDLGKWVQYYAFDTIASMSFSETLGFLDQGDDVDGTIQSIENRLDYSSVIGQMPWLDELLEKNPLIPQSMRPTSYVVRIAKKHIEERLNALDKSYLPQKDFLAKFIASKDKAEYPDRKLLSWTTSNVFAGSDTTAISLRSIFYYLLKNPSSLSKLRAEIDSTPSAPIVSWAESQSMPYLDACIREAMRLHPVTGTILERVVPAGGRVISGKFFAEGTIIGISPWIVQRNKDVYGMDAESWRPERWLEADAEARKGMERTFLGFGAGTRTCIGKNVSKLEMYKMVPTLLKRFEMELAHPEKEWKLHNAWFCKQSGVLVKFRGRQ